MKFQQFIIFCYVLLATQLSSQTFTNYTTDEGLAHNTVNCLAVDEEDNLWFGTDGGVSYFDETNNSWMTLNVAQGTGLIDDRITAIHISPNSGLWVGTDFGISHWDGTSFTSYTEADGIGDNRIQWIAEGSDNVLYFANRDGFTTFHEEEWQVFASDEGLPFGGVKSLDVIDNDIVVLGLGLGGLGLFDHVDTSLFIINDADGLLSNKVKSVYFHEDEDGNDQEDEIWVASDNGMNRVYADENDQIAVESHPSVFELPPPHEVNQLTDVKIDSKGIVWAGVWIEYLSSVGGISFYDGDTWTTLDVDDGLVGPVVYQLAINSEDCVWVATSTGVSKYCSEVSANKELKEQAFNLYPNPTHSYLIVELNNNFLDVQELVILNAQMETLSKQNISTNSETHTIDLGQHSAGVYFLKIGNELQKFIKL